MGLRTRARQSLEACVTGPTTSSIANFRESLLLGIKEFRTSKTCSSCFNADIENLKSDTHSKSPPIHQILICDVMTSKNMLTIARSIWNGQVSLALETANPMRLALQ
ncbi:hypothetical protein BDF21DRAFT_491510 [Thamnidium elegans]|nr:hypothetical protein BDF21DRAFT_491510 [Thamnidium elegans]